MTVRQLSTEEKTEAENNLPIHSLLNSIFPSWTIVSMSKRGIIHTAHDGSNLAIVS